MGSTFLTVAECGGILAGFILSFFYQHEQETGAGTDSVGGATFVERSKSNKGLTAESCRSLGLGKWTDETRIDPIASREVVCNPSDRFCQNEINLEATIFPQNEIKADESNQTKPHQAPELDAYA